MIEATMADLRKSISFFTTDEIVHIVNGRKKEEVGFFVPTIFKEEFSKFIEKVEKKKKLELLKRVAISQKQDSISDGAVEDGIK
ncbi:MAG: hypothetical protein U9Q40_06035 [Campylobacterota bacterium]|nr:hypothetical protein [Campylobacterota bacterium]